MNHSQSLIATIAEGWTDDPSPAAPESVTRVACSRCADSDLVAGTRAVSLPHARLHRLVAPIEEVLDEAVERYVRGDAFADPGGRDQRLDSVDSFRNTIRSAARAVIDQAVARDAVA